MNKSIEHQGRDLLHVIGLLTKCLRIRRATPSMQAAWGRKLVKAREALETLFARGLRRDFVPAEGRVAPVEAPREARSRGGVSDTLSTGLMPWQRELVLRLERGLGRGLGAADAPCIVWNVAAETMCVAARPLLGELRANNLTSSVFRGPGAASAARRAGESRRG